MKLSIIGLGKLGAPMAAVMAHKGHTVVGVDINPRIRQGDSGRPAAGQRTRSGGDDRRPTASGLPLRRATKRPSWPPT